jgi:deoxyribose-phosphate aldolase
MKLSRGELAKMIDHSLIKTAATKDEIAKLCWEAEEYGFSCVAVNSFFVSLAANMLKTSEVKACPTVGFPIGSILPEIKAFKARRVVELGAEEIDIVMKSMDYEAVKEDIKGVLKVKISNSNIILKVTIEAGLLTEREKTIACEISKQVGADFVKTSTDLIGGEATVKDIKLMRKTVRKEVGVKAAGGIRTLEQALAMVKAGANRIGTSAAVKILEEMPNK